MNENILLVEDEQALRTSLSLRLRSKGYVVDTAVDGDEALEKATNLPDLIILDLMLPHCSGLDVCRYIRQAGIATPILILTARTGLTDKVVGLGQGADDYLTKPFEAHELLARIEALVRRVHIPAAQGIYKFGSICVDVRRAEVTRDGKPVYLAACEFQLLRYLIERRGITVPRAELSRLVLGYDTDIASRTIETHVINLRQKLEEDPKRPALIITVQCVGYKFRGSS